MNASVPPFADSHGSCEYVYKRVHAMTETLFQDFSHFATFSWPTPRPASSSTFPSQSSSNCHCLRLNIDSYSFGSQKVSASIRGESLVRLNRPSRSLRRCGIPGLWPGALY